MFRHRNSTPKGICSQYPSRVSPRTPRGLKRSLDFPLFEPVEVIPPIGGVRWVVTRCSFDWKAERLARDEKRYRWLGCFLSFEEAKAAATRDAETVRP